KQSRYLADLAQLRQGVVVEPLALFLLFLPVLETRPVVLVESVRILLGQPVHFRLAGNPGVEVGGLAVLVEGRPQLVADMVLTLIGVVLVLGRTDAIALQIPEQRTTVLL